MADLKGVLIERGVKQKWLAEKLGVSEVTVSSWCKEKSEPTQKNLNRISEILHVSIDQLLGSNQDKAL